MNRMADWPDVGPVALMRAMVFIILFQGPVSAGLIDRRCEGSEGQDRRHPTRGRTGVLNEAAQTQLLHRVSRG